MFFRKLDDPTPAPIRHDTQPAESEDCEPHDMPPVVDPESVASAFAVTLCLFGGFVIALIAWVLS